METHQFLINDSALIFRCLMASLECLDGLLPIQCDGPDRGCLTVCLDQPVPDGLGCGRQDLAFVADEEGKNPLFPTLVRLQSYTPERPYPGHLVGDAGYLNTGHGLARSKERQLLCESPDARLLQRGATS